MFHVSLLKLYRRKSGENLTFYPEAILLNKDEE
jgi:hypothetical protein